jgi:hypothetical protein
VVSTRGGSLTRNLLRSVVWSSLAVVAAFAAGAGAARTASPLPLREVALLELPGPANRFDYQSLDPSLLIMKPA